MDFERIIETKHDLVVENFDYWVAIIGQNVDSIYSNKVLFKLVDINFIATNPIFDFVEDEHKVIILHVNLMVEDRVVN